MWAVLGGFWLLRGIRPKKEPFTNARPFTSHGHLVAPGPGTPLGIDTDPAWHAQASIIGPRLLCTPVRLRNANW